jgi:hypothetical protein
MGSMNHPQMVALWHLVYHMKSTSIISIPIHMDNIYRPGSPQRENAEHFFQPDAFNVRPPLDS